MSRLDRRLRTDRGGASVWLLAAGAAVLAIGFGALAVGAAITARHRAAVAADFGALAAAVHASEGSATACVRAAAVVAANRARLVSCRLEGLDAVVIARVRPAGIAGLVGEAESAARAGPVRVQIAGQTFPGAQARRRGTVETRISGPGAPPRSG